METKIPIAKSLSMIKKRTVKTENETIAAKKRKLPLSLKSEVKKKQKQDGCALPLSLKGEVKKKQKQDGFAIPKREGAKKEKTIAQRFTKQTLLQNILLRPGVSLLVFNRR
jgi:hypothetical protein